MAARRRSFYRPGPVDHPERHGTLVLAIDPGENQGYAICHAGDRDGFHWIGTSLVETEAMLRKLLPLYERAVVLVEDQYQGKASFAAKTTLSQRAGYFAGYLRVPEEWIHFVKPKDWYWAIGMGVDVTKPVCMERIRRRLSPGSLKALAVQPTTHLLDVLAAIGIAWSYPFLTETSLTSGQKMVKIKPKARKREDAKKQPRRAKARRRLAGV